MQEASVTPAIHAIPATPALYQTHIHVQYKQIETELLEKPEWRASLGDVQEMTHALYQLELSKVFGCTAPLEEGPTSDPCPPPLDSARIEAVLEALWQGQLAHVPAFAELVADYRSAKIEGTSLAHAPDDIVFATLFNYDLFYLLHPCLRAWLDQGTLPPEAWAALREQATLT